MNHLHFILFCAGCSILAFFMLRYVYILARNEAKGRTAPIVRIRRIKDIIHFHEWYEENTETVYDNWLGHGIGYTLDEFAIELFKKNPEVLNRINFI